MLVPVQKKKKGRKWCHPARRPRERAAAFPERQRFTGATAGSRVPARALFSAPTAPYPLIPRAARRISHPGTRTLWWTQRTSPRGGPFAPVRGCPSSSGPCRDIVATTTTSGSLLRGILESNGLGANGPAGEEGRGRRGGAWGGRRREEAGEPPGEPPHPRRKKCCCCFVFEFVDSVSVYKTAYSIELDQLLLSHSLSLSGGPRGTYNVTHIDLVVINRTMYPIAYANPAAMPPLTSMSKADRVLFWRMKPALLQPV